MTSKQKKHLILTGIAALVATAIFAFTEFRNPKTKDDHPDAVSTTAGAFATTTFRDGEGNRISLASLKGNVVFINFWATWCPPCIAEMPSINRLYETLKDRKDIVFLMVDVDGNEKKSNGFMTERGYKLPVLVPAGEISPLLLGQSIPTTVVLDKTGEIVFRHEGGADYAQERFVEFMKTL